MRFLHTMIRVGNLERSIKFYCEVMGMRVLRRDDYPEGKFTLVFVGYDEEINQGVIELTYNWDTDHYDIGNGYGHIAIGCKDVPSAIERIRAQGGKITVEPEKMGDTTIAFVEDPDGYAIELVTREYARD